MANPSEHATSAQSFSVPQSNADTLSERKSRINRVRWSRSKSRPKSDQQQQPQQEKVRPNFFLGFRIRDTAILQKISALQESIRNAFPDLSAFLINPNSMHVTLFVLHLPDEQAIQRASEVLRVHGTKHLQKCFEGRPPVFPVQDYGFFGRNDILHAKLDASNNQVQRLVALIEALHQEYQSEGFTTETLRKPLQPHVTIWKTSKNRNLLFKLNKKFQQAQRQQRKELQQQEHHQDPCAGEANSDVARNQDHAAAPAAPRTKHRLVQNQLAEFIQSLDAEMFDFGTEEFISMELLSMTEKDEQGYYKEYATVHLLQGSLTASDVRLTTSFRRACCIQNIETTSSTFPSVTAKSKCVPEPEISPLPQRVRKKRLNGMQRNTQANEATTITLI